MLRSFALLSFALACACSSALSGPGGADGPDAESPAFDASFDGGGALDGGSGPRASTYVRLAQMSPDLGPVDFCIRPKSGGETAGPLLAAPDAGDGGIAFEQASPYFSVAASGTVDVIVVPAPATDCATARAVGTVTLDPGKRTTLVVMGISKSMAPASRAVGVSAFVDEAATADALRLRVIDAALAWSQTVDGPSALAFALTSQNTVIPVAQSVLPRKAATPSSAPPMVDALGYHDLSQVPVGDVSARVTYGDDAGVMVWTSKAAGLSFGKSDVRTAFVVADALGAVGSLATVVCNDAPPEGESQCELLQTY